MDGERSREIRGCTSTAVDTGAGYCMYTKYLFIDPIPKAINYHILTPTALPNFNRCASLTSVIPAFACGIDLRSTIPKPLIIEVT